MAAAAAAAEAPGSWRAAAPRKRRRSAARRPRGREAAALGRETQTEADRAVVLRRLQEAAEDLLLSDFWSLALETIDSCLTKHLEQLKAPDGTLLEALGNLHLNSSPDESAVTPGAIPGETLVPGTCRWKCVCYGIGNFATCVIARYQLTFLLLFLEKCRIPRRHCWVYDPLFSQLEIGVLNSLGLTVLSENEEGKRSVDGEPTIFYMPHCGTALYNNLLWSNWSLDALSQMLLIGNSFRGLEERLLGRILQKNYTYIAKILKGLEELELPETSQYTDVFNDTSIHWFPVQKLQQLPTDTWAFQEEPDYQDCEDLEIIRRNKTRDH
ncbi:SRR1-like protein [Canis lupus familiaris]|uniref:SRR1-like domain-containing protein n=1 Tax=Canis lupus familiaris TaxID=9615 RepID=A0A8P0PKQ3_CANLF|nr:SRR1-like protein [Canis lupus familiaris]